MQKKYSTVGSDCSQGHGNYNSQGARPVTGFSDEDIFLNNSPRKSITQEQCDLGLKDPTYPERTGDIGVEQDKLRNDSEDHEDYYTEHKEIGTLIDREEPVMEHYMVDGEEGLTQVRDKSYLESDEVRISRVKGEISKEEQEAAKNILSLRKMIEVADKNLAASRKRFEEAEGKYIAAKLDFEMKSAEKNDLTDDLKVLIEQSESHKVRRMSELLNDMNIVNPQVLPMNKGKNEHYSMIHSTNSTPVDSEPSNPQLIDTS